MAIEAPRSKFKKTNLKTYIAFCIGLTIWCAYDGYFNKDWIEEHTDANGNPKPYLVINRNAPPILAGGAILMGLYLFTLRNKKLIADENELVFSNNQRIPYDSIDKIDKTHFDSKGFFIITYRNNDDRPVNLKIKEKTYDNLAPILDHLVAKIT